MIASVEFVVPRRVLGLLGVGRAPDVKDMQIAVLRHQLTVLHRQTSAFRVVCADRVGGPKPAPRIVTDELAAAGRIQLH